MKFSMDSKVFKNCVNRVVHLCNKKSSVPILANIKIVAEEGQTSFTAFTDVSSATVFANCEVFESGEFIVFCDDVKLLFNVEGYVTFESDGNYLSITNGKKKSRVKAGSAVDFPKHPEIETKGEFTVNCEDFLTTLKKLAVSLYSYNDSSARDVLRGYHLTPYLIETCDGYTAIRRNIGFSGWKLPNDTDIIINGCIAKELEKIICKNELVTVSYSNKTVCVSGEDFIYYTRLIEGVYPHFDAVFDKREDYTIDMKASDLVAIAKQYCAAKTKNNPMYVFNKADSVYSGIVCDNGYSTCDEVPVTNFMKSNDFEISFNAKYFKDVLPIFDDRNVLIKGSDPKSAWIITDEYREYRKDTEHYTCGVLPMAIRENGRKNLEFLKNFVDKN